MTCRKMCVRATFGVWPRMWNHIYTFIAPKNGRKRFAVWSDRLSGAFVKARQVILWEVGLFDAPITQNQKQ